MSAPLAPTTDARLYLDAVAHALADLPADDRAELLDDLAGHLAAVEREDGDVPLTLRLGSPDKYAIELRASAGLPPAPDEPPARVGHLRAQLERDWQRLSRSSWGREVGAFLPLLTPGWWVLRAYLVVFVLALMSGSGVRGAVLLDVGLPPVGWALFAAAVVGSVRLGRRSLDEPLRRLLLVGEVALAGLAATVLLDGTGASMQTVYVQESAPLSADQRWPLLSEAGPVTDVFPYAADGTPLEDVLLFDQDGRPLRVGVQEWWADGCQRIPRPPLADDGVPVPFSYPQRYVLDGEQYGAACDATLERPEVPLPELPASTTPPAAEVPEPPAAEPVPPAPAPGAEQVPPAPAAEPAPAPEQPAS